MDKHSQMKLIYEIDQIDERQWEQLLLTSQTRNFFQTRDCYELYAANSPIMEAFCFAVENNGLLKGVIVGFIQRDGGRLKRFFSRRAIINGGPLLADDITEEELSALIFAVKRELRDNAIYIEIRNFFDYSNWVSTFTKNGFRFKPHYDFIVNTETIDIVHSNMGKSRKRDVNVSLKNGLSIIDSPTEQDIIDYYAILENLYRTKIKTPLYPLPFFMQLWQSSFSKFILLKYNNEVVGGTILVFDDRTVYEWYVCGKDGVYKNVFPSTVATYYSILYAAENNHERFDMMGAGTPDDGGYGVREFKSKFGGKLVEPGRFLALTKPFLYQIGRIGVKILKYRAYK